MRTESSRYRLAIAGLIATLLIGGAPASSAAPTMGGSGVGDHYFPQDGNGGIDVVSYRIKQRWQPKTQRLSGSTTLRLRSTAQLRSFNLDFMLRTTQVTVNGRKATFSRPTRHELKITPRTPLAKGELVRVRVRYSGYPLKQRYAGESGMTWAADTLIAVNQPHIAPYWFPGNDHPSDRARLDVTTTVPRGLQVIGNGNLVARKVRASSTTWRWRAAEPMASYLAYFVAGPLKLSKTKDHAGRQTWYAVSRKLQRAEQRGVLKTVQRTPGITRWLEGELGRPYPWRSNGAVVVPGLNFALETQGRPVYGPWVDASTVVHEIAHQWFGNQVTVRRWQDIWLNEGFATYLEWLYEEKHGGATVNDMLHGWYAAEPAGSSLWRVAPGSPGAKNLFHTSVYIRGAMTLAALRQRIGAAKMRTLLTSWLAQRSGSTATVAEFTTLAEQISGQDLDAFFDTWLYQRTRPAPTAANGLTGAG